MPVGFGTESDGERGDDRIARALDAIAPHLEEILAGYQEAHPLRDGWHERTGLHQLFVLIAHAVLFDPPRGGSYLGATDRAARSALELL